MASMRVLQLAKEYGLSNKEMLEKVIELGIPAKSHASVLTEENVAKVREALGEASVDEKTGEPAERPLTKEEIEALIDSGNFQQAMHVMAYLLAEKRG